MKYQVRLNDTDHEVTLLERSATSVKFSVQNRTYEVRVMTPSYQPALSQTSPRSQPATVRPAPTQTRQAHPGEVLAPMPGIIVQTPCPEGKSVQAGETVCVIEAMKMENNIPAPCAGVVRTLHVKAGQEVQSGQLLISISAS